MKTRAGGLRDALSRDKGTKAAHSVWLLTHSTQMGGTYRGDIQEIDDGEYEK